MHNIEYSMTTKDTPTPSDGIKRISRKDYIRDEQFRRKVIEAGSTIYIQPFAGNPYDYDYVIDKSTSHAKDLVRVKLHVISTDQLTLRYSPHDMRNICDFIAAYLTNEDRWYIIPTNDVAQSMRLTPPSIDGMLNGRARLRDGKYAKYMEAWDLVGPKDPRRS